MNGLWLDKNTDTRLVFPIRDASGALVSGAAGLDSEYASWAATSHGGAAPSFADCGHEATEIGSTGFYFLDVGAAEINADFALIAVKTSASGAVFPVFFIRTRPQSANLTQINANAVSNNTATLALKVLTVINSAGDAVVMSSTGANGSGLAVSGNGSGHGLKATKGTTGSDISGSLSGSVGSITSFGTLVADIVEAIGAAAEWGLSALETLLVTTGIRVTTNTDKVGYSLDDTYAMTPESVAGAILDTPANKLVTDVAGSVVASNMVAEPPSLNPVLDAVDDVAADVAVIREATTFAPDEVLLTQDTLDTGDVAIGITTPGATVTAYLRTDVNRAVAKRSTTAETDGGWQLQVARSAEYTLVFTHDRYRELTREVDVP